MTLTTAQVELACFALRRYCRDLDMWIDRANRAGQPLMDLSNERAKVRELLSLLTMLT